MAIAAYTSLVSLSDILDNVYDRIEIQYPPLDAQQFHALRENLDFLLCKVNAHSEIKSEKMRQVWWDIAIFAHEADEIIDAHVVDLLHQEERYTGHSAFSEQMESAKQVFDMIKEDLLIAIEEGDDSQGKEEERENTTDAEERVEAYEEKSADISKEDKEGEDTDAEEESADIQKDDKEGEDTDSEDRVEAHREESADIQKEEKEGNEGGDTHGENVQAVEPPKVSSSAAHALSATSSHNKDDNVVGLDDKLIEIKDQLTNSEAHLQIIAITGMGGIGKTTLAEEREEAHQEESADTQKDDKEGEETDSEERVEAHEEESVDISKEDKEGEETDAEEESTDIQKDDKEGEDTDSEERVEAPEEESVDIQKQDKEGGDTHGENVQDLEPPKVSSTPAHDEASSATSSQAKNDYVVGLDEKVMEIVVDLVNNKADLQIITITGMGGIGKTTLAKTVYDAPFAADHFDVRLWVTVSQNYDSKQVHQGILDSGEKKFFSGLGASTNHGNSDESSSEIGVKKLYKRLFNRRYLVVMDDVWSSKVWEDLKWFFPDNENGSRILVTTRDSIVSSSFSPASEIKMEFLYTDNSWKLLCQKAFPKENGDCPIPELEEVGMNIARGCKGLPLSIVVIGSMLATSPMTREYWESVAKDVNSFRNLRDDGHYLKVLSLSFNNLPIHLKACFLYTSLYRDQIEVSELFRDWITWGLIHPIQHRSKKSVAEEYLTTLVDRNLILIHERYADRKIYSLGLHDLLRDLCREELKKHLLLFSPRVCGIGKQKTCVLCGKLCGDKEESSFSSPVVITPSPSQVSPFICKTDTCPKAYPHIKRLCLVKVMNIVGEYSSQELVRPTTTRVQILVSKIPNDIEFVSPSFAHLLWRLHTLVLSDPDSRAATIVLPSEIWRMPQLKDIRVFDAILTYPSETGMEGTYFIILKNLYRLERIRKFRCTPEVVCRIPNLEELSLFDSDDSDSRADNSLCNLAMFQKLEFLFLNMPILTSENISFPNTLTKLILKRTRIPWEDMTMIGSLPNLEWLHLMENAFIGPEWNPTEGEFLRLKVLRIESHDDLLYWNAEKTHFPILEILTLVGIHQELGIPDGIGDIPTLEQIQLDCCGEYVIDSAKQIWKEQREDYGNEELNVFIIKDKEGWIYKLIR